MNEFNGNSAEVNSLEFYKYCSALAKTNPELLESELRAEIIEITLQSPEIHHPMLIQLQRHIDEELGKEIDQTSRMYRAFELLIEKISAKDGILNISSLFEELVAEGIDRQFLFDELKKQLGEMHEIFLELQKQQKVKKPG